MEMKIRYFIENKEGKWLYFEWEDLYQNTYDGGSQKVGIEGKDAWTNDPLKAFGFKIRGAAVVYAKTSGWNDVTITEHEFVDAPKIVNCVHCFVPLDVHGTCCGWINAKHICEIIGGKPVILDARHPGCGVELDAWKQKEILKS
jgi:hypothetical protein